MLKKITMSVGLVVVGLGFLFFLANRPLSEMLAYFQAGASTTVKSIENEIPDVVHDEKAEAEIRAARQQLVDRQVQLSLSQNQLEDLQQELVALTDAIENRKEVLASAYPVLEEALTGKRNEIVFVNTKFTLDDFQHEIDDLLAMQQRDENALKIKREGYERLAKSVADGDGALSEMKNGLLEIEQNFVVLKARRDQARMESETLDLVASATADQSSTASEIGKSVDRLEGQVEALEVRNQARRDMTPVEHRVATNKLANSYNRLETLKQYAAEAKAEVEGAEQPAAKLTNDEQVTNIAADEVVIKVRGKRDAQTVAQDD